MSSALLLARTTIATPIGPMLALATDDALCALEFHSPKRHTGLTARLARWFAPHEIVEQPNAVLDHTRRWLADYFNGVTPETEEVPLDMRGAPFELRVWNALRHISAGETASYGDIARQLGAAGASRAVGMANGANPLSIIVPCHRVIGSNGTLTGYGGGLERKRWLLDHEQRWRTDRLF